MKRLPSAFTRPPSAASQRWINRILATLALATVAVLLLMDRLVHSNMSVWVLALTLPAAFLICVLFEWTLGRRFAALDARFRAWSNRANARQFFELARVQGVPIRLYWSFFAVPLALLPSARLWPSVALSLFVTSSLVILLHEIGHAVAARRRRCRVLSIELHALHGRTTYTEAWSERDAIAIAWGGVAAQFLVAVPVWATLRWCPPSTFSNEILLKAFGPYSLAIAAFNLLPVKGLDGAVAWQILRRSRMPRGLPRNLRSPLR